MSCRLIQSPITGEEIKSKAWDGIMGEVANEQLADKLYAQLNSMQFRSWFGDWTKNARDVSQVRDENGEPLVLFHSSMRNFDEFKEEFSKEVGFHFGSEIAAVERHYPGGLDLLGTEVKEARADLKEETGTFEVYPVFLNIRNIIEGVDYLDAEHNEEMPQEEYNTLYKLGYKSFKDEMIKLVIAFYQKGTITREQVDQIFNKEIKLKDALNADGYWYINRLEGKGEKSYVVFDMNNIKSIHNNGQYSLNDNVIYNNLGFLKSEQKLSSIPQAALHSLSSYGIVNSFNPGGEIEGGRWYFSQTIGLDESQRRFHEYMSMNNLNEDMFKIDTTKNGIPFLKPNTEFNLRDTIAENNEKIHKDKYEAIIGFLSNKMGISKDRINYITKKEFAEKFPDQYMENSQSVYSGGKFYFFTNNQTADITVEELLHPFIYTVREMNRELFDNLLKEAQKAYPLLTQKIQVLYKTQTQSVRDQELVTQALARIFNDVYENEDPKSFMEVIKDFVKWMSGHLNDLLQYFGTGKTIHLDVQDLHPTTSLEQIAQLLNATDTKFDVMFPEGTFYNLSTNPKDFQKVVVELLTNKKVEANVEKILVRLPSKLKSIEKRLTSSINETERQELNSIVKQIKELTGEGREDLLKAQLKGILTTVQLFNTLEDEMNTVDMDDTLSDSEKLAYFMSIHKTAESLDGFKDVMLDLDEELTKLRKENNINVQEFHRLISDAISAKDKIVSRIQKLVFAPLLEELVQSNEHTYLPQLEELDIQIKNLEAKIASTGALVEKNKLTNQLVILTKERKGILSKAPTRENLTKVFNGEFKDANQLSRMFESKIANGHPLVNTLQSIINDIYDSAGGMMVNSKNEATTASDTFTKESGISLRDMKKRFEGIGDDLVSIPTGLKFKEGSDTELELDKDGKPQFSYIHQNALVQEIGNEYITQYMELELLKEHFGEINYKNLISNVVDVDAVKAAKDAYDNFQNFKKENSQREYSDEYYAFRAMLDEKVGDKTLRQITGDAYDEISRLENLKERADSDTRMALEDNIKEALIQLKKLKSEYNDDGSKKDEDGLKIATLLKEYDRLKFEFGDYILIDSGEAKYKFDMAALERMKDQYDIPEQFQTLVDKLQQKVISQDYFDTITSITDSINDLSNRLIEAAQEGDIAQYADEGGFKEKKKDVYKEIRDITKPYRDENQVIDGIILTNQNPDLVARIKVLQQYIEDFKFESSKLTSLSQSEVNELNALKKNDDKTVEEENTFKKLISKRDTLNDFKESNTSIITELNALFKELGTLSTTSTTEYYKEMIERQESILRETEETIEAAESDAQNKTTLVINKIRYTKIGGRWTYQQKIGKTSKTTTEFLSGDEDTPFETGNTQMVEIIKIKSASEQLKDSQWWADNHYTQYEYNSKTGVFEPNERPLYIWEQQTPKNPNFIEIKPARGYYSYKVKDSVKNTEYSNIYKNIPSAKKGKFINKQWAITQRNPAKAKYLKYLTEHYNRVQEIYPDNLKMGHILPAVIHTEGENAVNMTNKVLSFDGTFKEMFKTNAGKTDTDTSYLIGGSQSNSQSIPTRFVGRMDTSNQTKNALASILLFEYHASLYNALNQNLPLFEASQLLAAKVDTLERKNYIQKLDFKDKFRQVFKTSKEEEEKTQVKKTEKESHLSKSVDDILNTFVYGQRMHPSIVNLGPFGNVDLAKVSSGVLGFAAKAIFVGNIISAINNSVSTRLQAIINSGVKSKLYTLKNLANAQRIAANPKIMRDLLSDWTKLGNKSLIGQMLEHFSFLAENPGREITSKAEFTLLKNKFEFLASAKQISEFEVLFIQFMTIADNTLVKVNGKDVKLSKYEDIYEIKDGKFQLKAGVEFNKRQEKVFRDKFQSMARKLAGAYRITEISNAETNWAGKAAFFLRRYFVGMATNRFAGERWNSQEMEVQIGYQKETFNNLVKMFKDYQHFGMTHWAQMSQKEKVSMYKTLLEYGSLFLMIALLSMAGGDDDKEKLKKNSWGYNMMLVTLLRAKSELEQFTIKGTDDIIRMGKNPFMIFTTFGNVAKIIGLSGPTVFGQDQAFYKQNTGMHKKGDAKIVATFLKLIGYSGATWHPEEYYINFKSFQNR